MRAEVFLDTNILLYAASRAAGEQRKRAKARELLGLEEVGLSVQVLAEFYVNATAKLKLPDDKVIQVLESWKIIRFSPSPRHCFGRRSPSLLTSGGGLCAGSAASGLSTSSCIR